ncbi:MAG: putative Glycerol-1-phosphate dehydrogenase [NAD(P)+] [Promethearchaeota archaeon]|nr:MAG: putative Glycerol-1-phosphate dehydrogenase [NAD(P)+] [Candidatus Lokiarchaeota archaeon]
MMKPVYGNNISVDELNEINNYILVTMDEPWELLKPHVINDPSKIILNRSMDIAHLEQLYSSLKKTIEESYSIIGIGGGTSCDTAKYLSWRFKKDMGMDLDLILMPSIISVDAFLCSSIAVRSDNKVNYIGESTPKKIIIDYNLIQKAPKYLNRAGVSDTISITSALGDWKLAHSENNEPFDQKIFAQAITIAKDLMNARNEIKDVTRRGIKALVDGFVREVALCSQWGNARPEEGSEHFLAYCIESITHSHYIHGQIIGMDILISLYLQDDLAQFSIEEIRKFFHDIELNISPNSLSISSDILRSALKKIQTYVKKENLMYSIYNSPRLELNTPKIEETIRFITKI